MKLVSKILFFLVFFLLLTGRYAVCQETGTAGVDEEFNLFLFSLAFIFICGLLGAAIIGAFLAILITLLIFGLITIGVFSASVIIGFYKRSIAAGFASFLYFIFCISCMAISTGGIFLVNLFITIPFSNFILLLTGLTSGLLGGILLSFCTNKLLQLSAKAILRKLPIAQ